METAYEDLGEGCRGIEHEYGEAVRILADPYSMSLLTEMCTPGTGQPRFNDLLDILYRILLQRAIAHELPRSLIECDTNMKQYTPLGVFRGQVIDRATRAVTVNVARAGTVPSHICQQVLHQVLDPQGVRQDHVIMERTVDDSGAVTGAALHGSKIGGDVDGRYLFFADPMGATGSSLLQVIQHYRENVGGTPERIVAAHLIVTPEYIRRMTAEVPGIKIWTLRLDRGASPDEVLGMIPGRDSRESGLNEVDYIVPGAGGVGEIINNSWI
ncbi:MAG: uracil phosphoribosyltransferase [Planctomycetes bacterium]|nr:uracil phosphoribosyltransferase [Planctomycetota bacterium]MBT6452374.1 uracil phosphoribosyltransferase [Planctomycetota bacterium]MBT6540518.1 uracil phosphoribosyltransferase [Planctomycetota bacterium]MBT6784776.1 uracil phosphoribosyltransferase [Planctomycetota bacterium]MBT6969514.1 uracil phosphoribosyltransferase [Planctomycetota bacterium]